MMLPALKKCDRPPTLAVVDSAIPDERGARASARFNGKKLNRTRLISKLTQWRLAEQARVSVSSVRRAEKGMPVSLETALSICATLNCPPKHVVVEEDVSLFTESDTTRNEAENETPARFPHELENLLVRHNALLGALERQIQGLAFDKIDAILALIDPEHGKGINDAVECLRLNVTELLRYKRDAELAWEALADEFGLYYVKELLEPIGLLPERLSQMPVDYTSVQ